MNFFETFGGCGQSQSLQRECDAMFQPSAKLQSSSRRTHSFSSSSSLSSCSSSRGSYYFPDDSPVSPVTLVRSFSGIPFSWEHLPGIPKKQTPKLRLQEESTISPLTSLLPLPPNSATPPTSKRFNSQEYWKKSHKHSCQRDPFFDAFVECSKDGKDDEQQPNAEFWNNNNDGKAVSRSLSDRFGFLNLYSSCKRTCAVSESIVYLPRTPRASFDLLNHRTSR